MADDPFFLPDPPRRFRFRLRPLIFGAFSVVVAVLCAAAAWWVARGPGERPPHRPRVGFPRNTVDVIPRLPGEGRERPPRRAGPQDDEAASLDPAQRYRLDQQIDLPPDAEPPVQAKRPLEAPPVDPDDPSSAALGTPL